ncbi:MAG: class I SAM-dependent methyltransferase [Candidatus Electryonea clarkiae]|nr:class I SAM-dependent methyltransferase [Candidatus Electryonea clarkiae]MDP8287537.1 class I SAM-dependent methyltransferase [Candidatus Electryonea clarkiae]
MSVLASAEFENIPVEKVEDYWNQRPCNIRHSTAEIGTREYYDQVEARKYKVEPHIPPFAEFKRWKGKKVLEIGCGIGTDTINFARAGAEVTAVDLSGESIKIAEQRARVFQLQDRIKFYQGSAEELSSFVPVEDYDLIYSFGVIHHTPNPENVIKEIHKFSRKNTVLKIMVYYRWSWKVLWILGKYGNWDLKNIDKWIANYSEAQSGCPVTYSYDKKTVRTLLKGFKVTRAFPEHIFPYRIPDYKEYRYVKEWYWRWMPIRLFRGLERLFGWHLCVDAITR